MSSGFGVIHSHRSLPAMARGFDSPDVLVLGGGGILGEAWMLAVLAGIEESAGFDARVCDGFVGTSAGSIVAASLVAGTETDAPLRGPAPGAGHAPERPGGSPWGRGGGGGYLGVAGAGGLAGGSAAFAPLA